VSAAFDVSRRALLDKLGFSDFKPATLAEERRLWQIVNLKLSFPGQPIPDFPYKAASTSLRADPVTADVTFTRTVSPGANQSLAVTVVVTNTGPLAIPATGVVLHDEVPDGLALTGAPTVNGAPATLLSVNPIEVDLGGLPYYESRTVVYTLGPKS